MYGYSIFSGSVMKNNKNEQHSNSMWCLYGCADTALQLMQNVGHSIGRSIVQKTTVWHFFTSSFSSLFHFKFNIIFNRIEWVNFMYQSNRLNQKEEWCTSAIANREANGAYELWWVRGVRDEHWTNTLIANNDVQVLSLRIRCNVYMHTLVTQLVLLDSNSCWSTFSYCGRDHLSWNIKHKRQKLKRRRYSTILSSYCELR